ncbi:glycosyltransferase family 2 protein [Flavobacterium agrisoli]|uniref:Glycosyltransferase n=1 Tax=Flavobacterium agrisoli TaxID=2793066 RepID=A0A934PL90_9FLAO|nr:glycosyltransferase [Flavobacterium agrisoli]MBK0368825.1 glycosyltransferase [Flavobacterium agrisoli]
MNTIAVVILNWNGKQLLEQFLPSIIAFSPEATLYVADNASTDDSVSFIKQHFPEIQIIQNSGNFGFAKGYNEALKHIDAEIFALVNSDIEVTENWLNPILENFKNEPNTAIIQPKILDFKKKDYFEYAGAAGGFIDKYGFPFCRGRIFDTVEKDQGQYDDSCKIFWASGACFFIRSTIYNQLNGFDNSFFAHQEEIDLCWRVNNLNFDIQYNPLSTVYHVGGATLNEENAKKTYLNFRNSLFMLVKNLPLNIIFGTLFVRLILDGIAGIRFLSQFKFKHFWAIIKAHFFFYWYLIKYCNKRTITKNHAYFNVKSIVFIYFLKKMTTFKEIFNSKEYIKT